MSTITGLVQKRIRGSNTDLWAGKVMLTLTKPGQDDRKHVLDVYLPRNAVNGRHWADVDLVPEQMWVDATIAHLAGRTANPAPADDKDADTWDEIVKLDAIHLTGLPSKPVDIQVWTAADLAQHGVGNDGLRRWTLQLDARYPGKILTPADWTPDQVLQRLNDWASRTSPQIVSGRLHTPVLISTDPPTSKP